MQADGTETEMDAIMDKLNEINQVNSTLLCTVRLLFRQNLIEAILLFCGGRRKTYPSL
mgnify:CR=1 FL=1